MLRLYVLFFCLLQVTQTYSQTNEFEMYYPEDKLFSKLKVSAVLDTLDKPARRHYKKEYDTLGRQISWRYVNDSVVTRFRYVHSGDTLIKQHYYTKGKVEHETYECEWFVYNRTGKISTYQRSHKRETSGCNMEKFFYDDKDRPVTKLVYINGKLVDVYSYTYVKNGNIVVKKQLAGKPEYRSIDSLYYNKANKLVKIVSRQQQAYIGEFAVNDFHLTKTISYETNKQTEKTYLTYALGGTDKINEDPAEVSEYIFYPDGLQQMWYHKSSGYSLSRLSYLVYEFHK